MHNHQGIRVFNSNFFLSKSVASEFTLVELDFIQLG